MKKTIIALLIVLTLIIAILCLKMSLLEYFAETTKFEQIITNLEDKYDIKRLKNVCKNEYEACINNEVARNTIIKIIDSEDLKALMFVTSPVELVSLRKCIFKNI
jgi:hypothetical protein|tara:strand:- start:555 stop:869 length:315 start_codon:yes stop_codon:yes gene_type:complete